ncbi:cytochrome c3 family protein [Desulfuromonas sp.]|uniref:cytochrome c3 family protein n=1 Tax=Desulfuromonas sp. TaxID=892 RepID=UPI0025B7B003|nr:cytochrome c3 family protein [Desulfuromonas sp.]
MRSKAWLAMACAVLLMTACGKQEEAPAEKTAGAPSMTEKMMEKTKSAAAKAEEAAGMAAEKVTEAAKSAGEKIGETTEAAKETMAGMMEGTSEQAQGKENLEELFEGGAAGTAVSQTVTTTEKTVTAAAEQAGAEVSTTVSKVAVAAEAPEMMTLENKMGAVSLPHKTHADAYGCQTFHGAGEPGHFELEKDKAHELCKGCHKKEGKGPTGCKDCHKK